MTSVSATAALFRMLMASDKPNLLNESPIDAAFPDPHPTQLLTMAAASLRQNISRSDRLARSQKTPVEQQCTLHRESALSVVGQQEFVTRDRLAKSLFGNRSAIRLSVSPLRIDIRQQRIGLGPLFSAQIGGRLARPAQPVPQGGPHAAIASNWSARFLDP